MKIYFINDQAFLELKPGCNYMVCIGTKAEVESASEEELMRIIEQALVISDFNSINDGQRRVVH